jgi:hypothetical protein
MPSFPWMNIADVRPLPPWVGEGGAPFFLKMRQDVRNAIFGCDKNEKKGRGFKSEFSY